MLMAVVPSGILNLLECVKQALISIAHKECIYLHYFLFCIETLLYAAYIYRFRALVKRIILKQKAKIGEG